MFDMEVFGVVLIGKCELEWWCGIVFGGLIFGVEFDGEVGVFLDELGFGGECGVEFVEIDGVVGDC